MDYDVLILGGGIIGCSLAYEISKYNLNIALIEKDNDIVDDISFVNTSVIYDGSETSNELMSVLEREGSKIIEEDCKKFNVDYKKVGSVRISENDIDTNILKNMYTRSIDRGFKNVYLHSDLDELCNEDSIKINAKSVLYAEDVSIMSPFDLAIAYGEVAADNGVNFRFEEKVLKIKSVAKGFKVTTNKNKFTCRVVINTIPNKKVKFENEELRDVSQEEKVVNTNSTTYLVVDNLVNKSFNSVIIKSISEDSFIINYPNMTKGSVIGIKSSKTLTVDESISYINKIFPEIKKENITNIFNEEYSKNEMYIDDSKLDIGYIRVTGNHYGKIAIAPAIARDLCESISKNLKVTLNKSFIDKRRDVYRFRNMSDEERNEIISIDKRYGRIICLCSEVSEGEIVDCIRRPLGARTVEGIKRRTGSGVCDCNGAYCDRKIVNILSREMNKRPEEIVDDSNSSQLWPGRIKEFNEV